MQPRNSSEKHNSRHFHNYSLKIGVAQNELCRETNTSDKEMRIGTSPKRGDKYSQMWKETGKISGISPPAVVLQIKTKPVNKGTNGGNLSSMHTVHYDGGLSSMDDR